MRQRNLLKVFNRLKEVEDSVTQTEVPLKSRQSTIGSQLNPLPQSAQPNQTAAFQIKASPEFLTFRNTALEKGPNL